MTDVHVAKIFAGHDKLVNVLYLSCPCKKGLPYSAAELNSINTNFFPLLSLLYASKSLGQKCCIIYKCAVICIF